MTSGECRVRLCRLKNQHAISSSLATFLRRGFIGGQRGTSLIVDCLSGSAWSAECAAQPQPRGGRQHRLCCSQWAAPSHALPHHSQFFLRQAGIDQGYPVPGCSTGHGLKTRLLLSWVCCRSPHHRHCSARSTTLPAHRVSLDVWGLRGVGGFVASHLYSGSPRIVEFSEESLIRRPRCVALGRCTVRSQGHGHLDTVRGPPQFKPPDGCGLSGLLPSALRVARGGQGDGVRRTHTEKAEVLKLSRTTSACQAKMLTAVVERPSPNEPDSQRKQSGSEAGQDQLCSMPEQHSLPPGACPLTWLSLHGATGRRAWADRPAANHGCSRTCRRGDSISTGSRSGRRRDWRTPYAPRSRDNWRCRCR